MLRRLLAHPLTQGIDIDSPTTTLLRARIIQEKPFLKKIYQEWYASLAAVLPEPGSGPALELGSGGGFLARQVPNLITSDLFHLPHINIVMSGLSIPFQASSLRAIVLVNVFHHLPEPRQFLQQATRCLKNGGVLVMIEPWATPWSTWVYKRLHNEPFETDAPQWEFPKNGPLSGANGALPWIIFHRDRVQFEKEFPDLHIQEITPFMPFRYLVSGGVSMRSLMPGWTFSAWRQLENGLRPKMDNLAMFARIVIRRAA